MDHLNKKSGNKVIRQLFLLTAVPLNPQTLLTTEPHTNNQFSLLCSMLSFGSYFEKESEKKQKMNLIQSGDLSGGPVRAYVFAAGNLSDQK